MSLSSGMRLGPYEVLALLGAGGMGEVYRAKDTRLGREVAVKVLPERLSSSEARRRFEREARTISALSHPNICALYDVGREGDTEYLVMELLEGETLSERLAKGPLSLEQTLRFGSEMAHALDTAHRERIVHRDLKPGNIMLTKSGVKLLDFGLAKAMEPASWSAGLPSPATGENGPDADVEETLPASPRALPRDEPLTAEGAVPGTVQYMAPEQLEGKQVDARTDIFALGAVLYNMATGRMAFSGASRAALISAILKNDPLPISSFEPTTPPALERVVKTCLEKDPDDRWQSAGDIARELKWIAAGGFVAADTPSIARTPRGGARTAWILAGSVAVLAAGALLFFRHPSPAQPMALAHSIAVLPFTNLSSDKEQEYFSDGLSEELMGLLTTVKELHVTGRTSSFAFKGKAEDLRTIGRKLNVATVLEGSVRRSGDQIRVSTRLVNTADGYQIWAETYDRKMTDVFAVQDEIAGAVMAALKMSLRPRTYLAARHRTSNVEAYNQLLLGMQLWNAGGKDNVRRALEAYKKAAALDPGCASAFAWAARAEFWIAEDSETGEALFEARRKALASADRAVALDPDLEDGYAVRGFLRQFANWDWAGAQADLARALAIGPGAASAHAAYAQLAGSLGRVPEAIAESQKATELDPLSDQAWGLLGRWLSTGARFPEARKALSRDLEINPESESGCHFFIGVTWLLERDPESARRAFQAEAAGPFREAGLAMAEHDLGHAKESQKELDELIGKYANDSAYQIALVSAWRGEREEAFEWLGRAYAQRDAGLVSLKTEPLLAGVRDEPRYAELLKKMNLAAGN